MSAPASSTGGATRLPEVAAAAGSALLAIGLFLPWYSTDSANAVSNIDGVRGELSGWTVHEAMRWVVLALAVIQFGLAAGALLRRQGAREAAEAGMVMGVNAAGIVVYFGLIYRPGDPPTTISLQYGWLLALAGALVALAAFVVRVNKSTRRRSGSPIAAPVK